MYAKRNLLTILKDAGLFLVSPVIALTYLALFPFIGITLAVKAWKAKNGAPATR